MINSKAQERRKDRRRGGRLSQAVITSTLARTLLSTTPAAAQWFGLFGGDDPLPPPRISRMLARQGFQDLSRPRFAGDVYIVHAISPMGTRVRLVVDAFDGTIVR